MSNKNNVLVNYVRDQRNNPVATVVAIGKGKIGLSICHSVDQFNKKDGRTIAIENALVHRVPNVPCRRKIDGENLRKIVGDAVGHMYMRSVRYFK